MKNILLFLLLSLLNFIEAKGQKIVNSSLSDFCHTTLLPEQATIYKQRIKKHNLKHGHDEFVVRIFVHIMRMDDGTGGISQSDAINALSVLDDAFKPHRICFSLLGVDEIHNTVLSNF